ARRPGRRSRRAHPHERAMETARTRCRRSRHFLQPMSIAMNHKPLISTAPVHSILNAHFRYTNSTLTDIRKTFERIRREHGQAKAARSAPSVPRSLGTFAAIAIALLTVRAYGQETPPSAYQLAHDRGCTLCHEVESPPRGS